MLKILKKIEKLGHEKNGARCSKREECGICSSRQELSNEYLVAKIGFDTAENEPLKVRITDHTFDHIPSFL